VDNSPDVDNNHSRTGCSKPKGHAERDNRPPGGPETTPPLASGVGGCQSARRRNSPIPLLYRGVFANAAMAPPGRRAVGPSLFRALLAAFGRYLERGPRRPPARRSRGRQAVLQRLVQPSDRRISCRTRVGGRDWPAPNRTRPTSARGLTQSHRCTLGHRPFANR